ncbi:MAG: hypothetical protein ACLQU3_28910 [Limisphaerales bacterium]
MKKFLLGVGAGIVLACAVGITIEVVHYYGAVKAARAAEAEAAAARVPAR